MKISKKLKERIESEENEEEELFDKNDLKKRFGKLRPITTEERKVLREKRKKFGQR